MGSITESLVLLEKSSPKIAYVYMLIGHLLMVIMWAAFKSMMNVNIDSNQILYVRGIMVFLFNGYVLKQAKIPLYPENQGAQNTLIIRFVIQMVSPLLQFYGISQLKISDATVLSLTSPIWVQLFCFLIYKEKLHKENFLYTLVSFAGIIFICRPAVIFGEKLTHEDEDDGKNHFLGCILMLLGSMSLAVSQSLFKGLQGKTSNFVAMQYFYFSNLISTPCLLIYKGNNDLRIFEETNHIYMILFITVLSYCGQLALSRGFILESPAKLSQLAYTRIVYAFVIDIFIFSTSINYLSLIGFALIIYSSFNIIKKK